MAGAVGRVGVRGVFRGEVVVVCVVAFLADVMAGIIGATFSLHADALGASVVLVGFLTSLTGVTSLVASVPLGMISDRVGRPRVLRFGMASFALAMALFAVAPTPAWLVPGRLLLGVAMIATFWIAAAYLGDIVAEPERGLAFGLLTTAMGLGFAVGPLVGGQVAEAIDTRAAYVLAAAVGLAGLALLVVALPSRRPGHARAAAQLSLGDSLRVGRDRNLIAAGIANVLTSVAFGGAVSTVFPLYGSEQGLSDAAIGTMFAVRALASTAVRLPSGALTGIVGSRRVVIAALAIELLAVTGIGTAERPAALLLWLSLEGIGYGAFLASVQAYIAEQTVAATRGAAIGFYSMTGGLGNALAPLALGAVGAAAGLAAVFFVSGGLGLLGLAAMFLIWFRATRRALPPAPADGRADVGREVVG